MSAVQFDFAAAVLTWYDQHGRKNLPWQQQATTYRVWVSEIMLQQTQVNTVIAYYQRFMQHFPDLESLAAASADDVLARWSGLGYYARARNLHKCAKIAVDKFQGKLPTDFEQLVAMPGIGRSTAGAILSLAEGQRHAILDGNVKRVLARFFAVAGWPGKTSTLNILWKHAEEMTPTNRIANYTQAMMDLGATVCSRSKPNCPACPLQSHCVALRENQIADYPGRKPKKILPIRERIALLLQNESGEILLQRRPPTGIWGGLLVFPMFENRDELKQWLTTNAASALRLETWPQLRHTFSHFQMDINPVLYRTNGSIPDSTHSSTQAVMEATEQVWYKDGTLPGGIPAPVSRLLKQLLNNSSEEV